MKGTTRLDGGPGKARASFTQLLIALAMGLVMALVAVGCNSNPTPEEPAGGTAGTNATAKDGNKVDSEEAKPGPAVDKAGEVIGSKTGGG